MDFSEKGEDRPERSSASESVSQTFSLENAIEVITISSFITGGALVIVSVLLGELVTAEQIGSYQLAFGGTGAAIGGLSAFLRWVISQYT